MSSGCAEHMEEVKATALWNTLVSTMKDLAAQQVDVDIEQYVLDRGILGACLAATVPTVAVLPLATSAAGCLGRPLMQRCWQGSRGCTGCARRENYKSVSAPHQLTAHTIGYLRFI